ncbi:MAG: DUF971 domain-containing protein [Gammaproteobacteria bacterium]|jgi:DUF971 family protein|nr:DUF971 domain-containing protein [Gammaproteobacteria bacterium]MBT3489018.1 DUF971 domain-containing protein [Gammaproteobacteria bacterium]MBT3719176.1 DUF971 domain-containing protein [Gammaproteobacteria bacterium]MBT3845000.1 DUF971 domain-containing protein [Gammaproteobacteria bacterium]MBT3894268.1 DUF971 domain-containing protein [Gammaproteobacteria bacterium]
MSEKRDITPTEIRYDKESRILTLSYEDGKTWDYTAEFLRVYSPSAEVRGHAPGEEKLQVGKEDVAIDKIDPVGRYAVSLKFDDGHDTGIYSWDWLYTLGERMEAYWQDYLSRLEAEGIQRMTTSERLAT